MVSVKGINPGVITKPHCSLLGRTETRRRLGKASERQFNKSLLGEPIVSGLREGSRMITVMIMMMMINTQY